MIPNLVQSRLRAALNQTGLKDSDIARGVRLKASGVDKLSRKLGVSHSEVVAQIDDLVNRLRSDAERLAEEYRVIVEGSRYGYEKDRLGNVTVRDSLTGDEVFLRGTDAAGLLSALAVSDEQDVLSGYMSQHISEDAVLGADESYEDEIKSDRGSYNFPWVDGRERGTATAEYTGRGDSFKIKLVSVRDSEGVEIHPTSERTQSLTKQAFSFIGQE